MALNILKRIADLKTYSLEVFYDNVQGLVRASEHRKFNTAILDTLCPVGTIVMYGKGGLNPSPPDGWLFCNGQTVSKTTYPELFAVLGSGYGTAPTGTFKLPDFVARFPMGYEPYGNSIGAQGGSFSHTLNESQLPSHKHSILGITGGDNSDNNNTTRFAGGDKNDSSFFFTNTQACQSVGSGQPIFHTPPYTVINFIIKS